MQQVMVSGSLRWAQQVATGRQASAEIAAGQLAFTAIRAVQRACDRCSQGVMDNTNPHMWGACRCECHERVVSA